MFDRGSAHGALLSFPTRRSSDLDIRSGQVRLRVVEARIRRVRVEGNRFFDEKNVRAGLRSEEHTSELQSRGHLVCRLLLEKKKFVMLDQARRPAIRSSRYQTGNS